MYLRRVVFAAACSVVSSVVTPTLVTAQEASPPPEAAAPVTTPLPPVVVEEKQTAKKPKASAKKKASSSAPSVATQQPAQQQPPPTGPGNSSASDKTAYGPVRDYSAKNTATGTKTDTPLKEVPQSISVVGAEQIRDSGSYTEQDVLRYVPGVVASAYGLDGRADGSFIRGTDATEFLDGMRRTFDYYTYTYRLDPFFMERMEVLRGPSAVLYGQSTVGGMINSVSKRPQTETGGEITVEYGSFDFKQVKFDMTGPITSDKKWSYRLTGLARDAESQVDFVDNDRYAIAPAITYRPDSNTSITLLGHFQRDYSGSVSQFFPHIGTIYPGPNGRIPQNRYGGEPGDFYDTEVAEGTLLIEHKFADNLILRHSSRYSDVHNDYLGSYPDWNSYDAVAGTYNRYGGRMVTDSELYTQDTNLEAKFMTGLVGHKLLGGVDYSDFEGTQASNWAYDYADFNVYNPSYNAGTWAWYNCGSTTPTSSNQLYLEACNPTTTGTKQTGLYAQDQMRLGNWIAVLGLRKDWIETTTSSISAQKDDAITYRGGLMYEFASGLTPYFSYSESFIPVVSPTFSGEPLKPQEGRMYEVGFKYQPEGANFAINGALYDIAESSRVATDDDHLYYYVQTGAVAIKGGEIEITGKLTKNLKVVGGYSYTQAQYNDGTVIDGNQIESMPKHMASLWGVWSFDQPQLKGWSVGAGARYIGKSWDSTNTIEVPDVTLFDAMIAYEEGHWRWQITGTNLEDEEVVSTCLARGDCFLGQARTIITGLTYKY